MYLTSIKKEINYRSPEYFISPIEGKYYKAGLYEFKPFRFSNGFAFVWVFSKHNGDIVYSGNSLHSISIFKTIDELKNWINDHRNLMELEL